MNTDTDFASVRRLFPITSAKNCIIYLNSASTGPLCNPVRAALNRYNDRMETVDPKIDGDAFAALEHIRQLGAKLIGARREEVGFGFHTGFGLNVAALGLPLKRGDEVLLSDVEFPSNVYPWVILRERGIHVTFVKSTDGFFDIENFRKAINRKTRVLSLSHVQFFNGYKNDIRTIGRICREHGMYFVVDGIQGCGIEPINVHSCHIDIYSAGAQKWLLSPLGTGLFYVRKDLQERMNRPFASWLGVDWKMNFSDLFHYDLPFFDSARQFELGTYPYGHVFAMEAALELITSLGVRNIQRHNYELLDRLIDFLKSTSYFRITSSLKPGHRSSILAFTCPDAKTVHAALGAAGIATSFREGAIRVSVHLFNNRVDINKLAGILARYSK
ncbi:MAG: aminotransferase class V-fold PLP-dependent enzyme [candidate division Zixibacteria bacterium]|nr:aminotransferase class V-fold PLP-dependent enzyme [candidate division Zixibacteria bacterium]